MMRLALRRFAIPKAKQRIMHSTPVLKIISQPSCSPECSVRSMNNEALLKCWIAGCMRFVAVASTAERVNGAQTARLTRVIKYGFDLAYH